MDDDKIRDLCVKIYNNLFLAKADIADCMVCFSIVTSVILKNMMVDDKNIKQMSPEKMREFCKVIIDSFSKNLLENMEKFIKMIESTQEGKDYVIV